jgi:hypothetical protein
MRLEPSDPDIETVVTRIERGDLDLQPEFQRGEVWSKAKKQRLVDSILRDWHIPPIHVIELRESRRQEVLDGQQRLAAIRDFVRGDFGIDGSIEPVDTKIAGINGKKFRELPDDVKRQFNQFTLRIFRIVDYKSDEPGELFFRLNQPTSLTSAEQRNAFFGPVRAQVKVLVAELESNGVGREFLGFSNSRMAYHDVIARVAITVERNTLHEKVTAADLVQRYRSENALSDTTVSKVRSAVELFGNARGELNGLVKFNKATIYSWFLFAIRGAKLGEAGFTAEVLSHFLAWFEFQRSIVTSMDTEETHGKPTERFLAEMIRIYADRSAARVADVSSVVLRDAAIWAQFEQFLKTSNQVALSNKPFGFESIHSAAASAGQPFEDDAFARALIEQGWGNVV